jgi:hypothetical protein
MSNLVLWVGSVAVVALGAYSWGFHNGSQAGFYHRRPERRGDVGRSEPDVTPEPKRTDDPVAAKVTA